MKKNFIPLLPLLALAISFCSKTEPEPVIQITEEPVPAKKISYSFSPEVSWADEFEIEGVPDATIWDYDLGGDGWGNNERQTYTDNEKNARIENGNLIIEARYQDDGLRYSSARLVTKNKKDFLYGRMEIKAKLPKGRGTWAAIWTLATEDSYGNAYWPDNGEMDIMEHVGMDQDIVHANIHTKAFNHSIGTNKGNKRSVKNASEEFHLYRLDWLPSSVQLFIDDKLLFEFKKDQSYNWTHWPYDKAQHLLLNIAIGGDWGGQQGIDDSIFPQQMLVDYVRYYEMIETVED